MGERRFLLVDSSALPDVFLKVLQAKELLASGSVSNISTAARQAGISRTWLRYMVKRGQRPDFPLSRPACVAVNPPRAQTA